MRAALLKKVGDPFVVEDVPVPEIGPDDVLVESKACGICRTDLHIQDGLAYIPDFPHTPGHEPAGVVKEVGSNITKFKPGDRVTPHLFVRSQDCCYSRAGHDAQALHVEGIIGVTLPGGFAEYFRAPARNLIKLPDEVSFEDGGLTSCAVITAVHGFRRARMQLGESAVVLGSGGIGVLLIQLLKNAGVKTVGMARSQASLDLAMEAGADLAVCANDADAADQVRAFSGADGVDCVFEMVGFAGTMKQAADCARRQGRIVVIGEEADFPEINTIQIAQRELEIIGSRNGGFQDAMDSISLMAQGVLRPPIAARFKLEEINEAMEAVRQGKVHGRVIVSP